MEYDPENGFESFLINADDQYTQAPTREVLQRCFPDVPEVDEKKIDACDGFGALVDCSKAKERLGWQPAYRCIR